MDESSPKPPADPRPNYLLHVGLFLATLVTTTAIGTLNSGAELSWQGASSLWSWAASGLPYSLSIMAILLTHEMGHFLLARYHGVSASLPYFIPFPYMPFGTLGAVIKMRGRVDSPNAIVDIGAAGPLAGLVVALPVLAYGLHLSPVGPSVGAGMQEGNSVLYLLLKLALKGEILPGGGRDVHLHIMAYAGWAGLLVTMLNLLPVGQLDGGHIAYAYFGKVHNTISRWLHRCLIPMAVVVSIYAVVERLGTETTEQALSIGWPGGMPWVVLWILLAVMKRLTGGQYHPPLSDEPLTPGRRRLCVAMILLFFLILVPIPMRMTLGPIPTP